MSASPVEGKNEPLYWSTDSAPARLTRALPLWAAPMVLALFTVVAAGMLLAVHRVPALAAAFPSHDIVFSPYLGQHSLPLRIFILSFYIAYSAVVGASIFGKVKFFFDLSLNFVLFCAILDACNLLLFYAFGFVHSLHLVEILSGLLGFFIFSYKVLDYGNMPKPAPCPQSSRFRLRSWLRVAATATMAALLAMWIDGLNLPIVADLRAIALLGGTGPGVFLFLPLFFLLLYFLGTLQALLRRKMAFSPPVTVIIPAHNEAHVIHRTLAAIDAAAARYRGRVEVLVLDNCSQDDTVAIAQRALSEAKNLTGRIVDAPIPGKALALNLGIAETSTDYVIRIDADTQVLPDSIVRAMRHFSRGEVGVVGGLPVAPGGGRFDRARDLETLLRHGFYQVGFGAMDAQVSIPGMFAVYRTDAVRTVGGFVTGMNGEDTDVSLRIGESGLRVVGDPTIRYISEVPQTYRHLREQRMRWFRSVYHVTSRNREYLSGSGFSVRGKLVLPFMLLNSGRRAMMLPLIIFGALYYVYALDPNSILTAKAVLATALGAPVLMAAFAALVNGRVWAVRGMPEYLLFRLARSYLTLESILSIAFEGRRQSERSSKEEISSERHSRTTS